MKVALSLLLVFASQWTSLAQGPLAKLEHVRLFGQDYVRLGDWASGFHFQTRWLKPAAELEVLSRWATLRFTIDSRKAEINGVNVWLSYAIAGHNGAAYITMLDLQTLLHPLLYPTKDEAPAQIKLICLDPGHGGKDPGEGDAASVPRLR